MQNSLCRRYFSMGRWLGLALLVLGAGCASRPGDPGAASPSPTASQAATNPSGTGTLEIRANGEDFVRQGFLSQDGWKITFDHVYVTLAAIGAYQTNPPYDATAKEPLTAAPQVTLAEVQTVDLAAGDAKAEPVLVATVAAPAGRYNAVSWQMPRATTGKAADSVILLVGQATKGDRAIAFTLNLDQPMAYQCGEFVGETRKGNLTAQGTADLELTFHFDHLFGDGTLPPKDELNQQALGFGPLAAIAQNGKVAANLAQLKQTLSSEDFEKFSRILPSLGHVGEGHCQATMLTANES